MSDKLITNYQQVYLDDFISKPITLRGGGIINMYLLIYKNNIVRYLNYEKRMYSKYSK